MLGFSPRSRPSILILAAGIGLFILIPGLRPIHDAPVSSHQSTAASISPGSTAYLSDRGTSIGVGADIQTFAALVDAVDAKDRKGYEELIRSDQAFLVEDRVQVLVIGFQGKIAEVRFLEGYHSQESGFVFRAWLKADRWH
ncbi:MAG: hypothetical protein HY646_02465 [Acidobacteria bacterium]|nr:hypothetical protein [Acidobacteriota bacterium]